MSDISLEDIASLCKRRGFIYQGSEIYGGLAGTWDYGPLGVALKRNIMDLWWQMFVDSRDDMYGIDAAILMNQKVWQASGHVDTFTDPMIECGKCKSRFRTDVIIDDHNQYNDLVRRATNTYKNIQAKVDTTLEDVDSLLEYARNFPQDRVFSSAKEELESISEDVEFHEVLSEDLPKAKSFLGKMPTTYLSVTHPTPCPVCGEKEWGVSQTFNMMFKTNVGPVESESSVSYLRPETAQGIFTNFKNVVDSIYPDMPFGLAQQGKAFRNEISPRDFVFRSREFEQMEIEYFVHPDQWEAEFEKWRMAVHEWCKALGLPEDKVHELEVEEKDRAHYSKRTIDFEFDFPHGRHELLGLAYRTDFDLKNIEKASGKKMEYRPKDGGQAFVPHVIEPSFGVERAVMAVLTAAYTEDEINGEKRTVLKLPKHLAPVKACVSPLLKNKPELVAKAREVYAMLQKELGAVTWDDNGNIGKRYRRQDEIGTPACITIDFQTLEDNTVTVRNRDTAEQIRVPIDEILSRLA